MHFLHHNMGFCPCEELSSYSRTINHSICTPAKSEQIILSYALLFFYKQWPVNLRDINQKAQTCIRNSNDVCFCS